MKTIAERRMFSKRIIDSDAFLDMPLTTQALYFHFSMRADDDGFVNNPRKIMRMIGASDGDAQMLLTKRFILSFDSGVIVIKHWRVHNYIQRDRYRRTAYQEERSMLDLKRDGSYTEKHEDVSSLDTECIQTVSESVSNVDTQVRLELVESKSNSKSNSKSKYNRRFTPPTLDDVTAYCAERSNGIEPQAFIDYYAQQGWKLANGNPMKDWKSAVRNWERREDDRTKRKGSNHPSASGAGMSREDNDRALRQMEAIMKDMKGENG